MKSEAISAFFLERINAGDFPSAVYLVAEKGEIRFADALGFAVQTNEIKIPARLETIYDLASLTKPLVTGLLCAKLIETGELKLSDKICQSFVLFNRENKNELTVRDLLAHASGFPAWKPFYLLNRTNLKSILLATIADEEMENSSDVFVRYSDLNFILLGFLIEKIFGYKKLDEIAESVIFEPLGLQKTFFNPPENLKNETAASELGNEYEKQTCLEMGYEISALHSAFRTRLIWGEVHDGNAWFMGGVSGHAGLFSTAGEIFKIALQFLPRTTNLLKPETCNLFRTNFTENLNEARSFAFELAATENSTASRALAKNSFGHLGFTGTSLWIEPETERVFILLTNRTHRRLPFVNINSTRRKFHELATESLDKF